MNGRNFSAGIVINAFFPVAELAIAPNQLEFNLNLVPRTMIRPFYKLLPALAALPLLFLSSCVSTSLTGATQYLDAGTFSGTPTAAPANGLPPDTVSFWDGGAGNGPARIHLKLNEQVVDFYRGNVLVGRSRVSSGDANHPTPTGNFSILEKHRDHVSSRYGDYVFPDGTVAKGNIDVKTDPQPAGTRYKGSPMTNFMRLTRDGVGMHTGFLPGYPASHGCVRMPDRMSAIFFENVQVGTPVLVTR